MKNRSVFSMTLIALTAFSAFAYAGEDKACKDLKETHKHVEEAIKNLEHHRDQGKRAAIIEALKNALNDVKVEKENIGCK